MAPAIPKENRTCPFSKKIVREVRLVVRLMTLACALAVETFILYFIISLLSKIRLYNSEEKSQGRYDDKHKNRCYSIGNMYNLKLLVKNYKEV